MARPLDSGEHLSQGRGSSDDLLEHRCLIDFFSQRYVFILESLLGNLAIVDIGGGDVPTAKASLLVPQRAPTGKKPAIGPVLSAQTDFDLVWEAVRDLAYRSAVRPLPIVRMKQRPPVAGPPRFVGETEIVKSGLVSIEPSTLGIGPQDVDMLRGEVQNLPKFAFVLAEFLFCLLALVNIDADCTLPNDLSFVVTNRGRMHQEPVVLPVFSEMPYFELKRCSPGVPLG